MFPELELNVVKFHSPLLKFRGDERRNFFRFFFYLPVFLPAHDAENGERVLGNQGIALGVIFYRHFHVSPQIRAFPHVFAVTAEKTPGRFSPDDYFETVAEDFRAENLHFVFLRVCLYKMRLYPFPTQ